MTRTPSRVIHATAPLRINDIGGWTDTWFSGEGKVLNLAISPPVQIKIKVYPNKKGKNKRVLVRALNYGDSFWMDPEKPDYTIYWGDIHSHCEFSHDGSGRAVTAFRYARDVSRLDFYALTDHSRSVSPERWRKTMELVKEFHEPGRFVTLPGYEWSATPEVGHNNVYYCEEPAAIFRW